MIARVEYPKLDAGPYLDQLDALGHEARRRVDSAVVVSDDVPAQVDPDRYARVMALERLPVRGAAIRRQRAAVRGSAQQLPESGARPANRHSGHAGAGLLEVARRAGLYVEGINFPGHFLLRCPARRGLPYSEDLIIDAFHGGALLTRDACRDLLRTGTGDESTPGDDDGLFESRLFVHATKPQILARMLAQSEAVLRAHAFVPAGPRHHRPAGGGQSVGHRRAARPRPARLSPEGLFRRAPRSSTATWSCRRRSASTTKSAKSTSRSGSTSRRSGSAWRR